MEIKLLPKSVRENLRSEINIRSVSKCLGQLVYNSLDAKSTCIAIRVNLVTKKLQVIDNGNGITKSNLKLIGFRYATSKYSSIDDLEKHPNNFLCRGESIASITKISKTVKIISRPINSSKTFCKIFENGKSLPISSVKHRPSKGTTIIIEDFMHNLPVRKKLINNKTCLDEIKAEIEVIALLNPSTSFSLRDDTTGDVIFYTYRAKFIYQTAAILYGKNLSKNLRKINYKESNLCISGLISLELHLQNNIQFIYVNKRFIPKTKVHTSIVLLISKSKIVKNETSHKQKHSAFIINIKCPYSEIDVIDYVEPEIEFKNWDKIQKFIENGLTNFLEKYELIEIKPKKDCFQNGSPLIEEMPKIRPSQIQGVIRGVPIKRKIAEETNDNEEVIVPKKQLVETSDDLEKKSESGKKIIMDMFLKSTAIYLSETENKSSTYVSIKKNSHVTNSTKISVTKTVEQQFISCQDDSNIFKVPAVPKIKNNLKINKTNKKYKCTVKVTKQSNYLRSSDFLQPAKTFKYAPLNNLQRKNIFVPKKTAIHVNSMIKNFFDLKANNIFKQITKNFDSPNVFYNKTLNPIKNRLSISKPPDMKVKTVADNIFKNLTKYDFVPIFSVSKSSSINKFNYNQFNNDLLFRNNRKISISNSYSRRNLFEIKKPSLVSNSVFSTFESHKFAQNYYIKNNKSVNCIKETNKIKRCIQQNKIENKYLSLSNQNGNEIKYYDKENISQWIHNTNNYLMDSLKNSQNFIKNINPTVSIFDNENNFELNEINSDNFMANISLNSNQIDRKQNIYTNNTNLKNFEEPENKSEHFVSDLYESLNVSKFLEDLDRDNFLETVVPTDVKTSSNLYLFTQQQFVEDINKKEHTKQDNLNDIRIFEETVSPTNIKNTEEHSFLINQQIFEEDTNIKNFQSPDEPKTDFIENTTLPTNSKSINSYVFVNNTNTEKDKTLEGSNMQCIINETVLSTAIEKKIDSSIEKLSNDKKSDQFMINNSTKTNDDGNNLVLSPTYSSPIISSLVQRKMLMNNTNFKKIDNSQQSFNSSTSNLNKNINFSKILEDLDRSIIEDTIRSDKLQNLPTEIPNSSSNDQQMSEWQKLNSELGNSYYLNIRTGMTSFLTPKSTEICSITKRSTFLPKGMSPILHTSSTAVSKKLSPKSRDILHQTIANVDNDELRTIKWMKYFQNKETVFDDLYSDIKNYELEIPDLNKYSISKKIAVGFENYSFTKNDFKNVTVLNQWDNKFIITKILLHGKIDLLVLFDQHAVHERIQLENLIKGYEENGKLKSTKSINSIELSFGNFEIKMLENYKSNFENWGLLFEIKDKENVVFTQIPLCWKTKDDSNVNNNYSIIESLIYTLIQEESSNLRNFRKISTILPTVIQNSIKTEACRTAIKFGDPLTIDQCENLIKQLLDCDLPFNCAHGRPTIFPIFDLPSSFTKKNEENIKFNNLK